MGGDQQAPPGAPGENCTSGPTFRLTTELQRQVWNNTHLQLDSFHAGCWGRGGGLGAVASVWPTESSLWRLLRGSGAALLLPPSLPAPRSLLGTWTQGQSTRSNLSSSDQTDERIHLLDFVVLMDVEVKPAHYH